MSRFSGPQQAGALRDLRQQRRDEAEIRQAAECDRDRQRAAQYEPSRRLTDREVDELIAAVVATEAARLRAGLAPVTYTRRRTP